VDMSRILLVVWGTQRLARRAGARMGGEAGRLSRRLEQSERRTPYLDRAARRIIDQPNPIQRGSTP